MIDLTTPYLGMTLKNPLVCSSSPMCENLDELAAMEAAGASAVVLHSLFEEQLHAEGQFLDSVLSDVADSYHEATTYLPELADYKLDANGYLEHVRKVKRLLKIPVIASLNGSTPGGWVRYARDIQQAGADALELNLYFLPTDGLQSSSFIESQYLEVVKSVRQEIEIPLAVKLSPFLTAPVEFGRWLARTGVNGLVLFNRFYQPDFDLEELKVKPTLHLSSPGELLLRLHWVAIFYGQVSADLAVTGGVHSALDVLKVMMAGGKVAMMTSALLKHGIGHLRTVLHDLETWMAEHEYHSIEQMRGSMSLLHVANPAAYERANYMKVLGSYYRK